VVGEVALTLVLLAAAGLLLRSYAELVAVDPGFNARNLLVAETALSGSRYAEAGSRSAFYAGVLERVRALPGVVDAGYVNFAPLTFDGGRAVIIVEGQPPPTPDNMMRYLVTARSATAGYLEALDAPLVGGRLFDDRDTADTAPAAVINSALAEKYWPNEDAVGRRFAVAPQIGQWITVAGVVGDVRDARLDVAAEPQMYLLGDQAPQFFSPQHLVVRTTGEPLSLAAAIRSAVWAVDAEQPVARIRSMREIIDAGLASRNTQLTLVGAFAARTRARGRRTLWGTLLHGRAAQHRDRPAHGTGRTAVHCRARVVGARCSSRRLGSCSASSAHLAAARLLQAFLFGVSAVDPLTFGAAIALLLVVSGVAAYLPARRAANVDPLEALRAE
jgi:putative ABC transport system permease protein